jgi:biopolymer transport protein ExbB
MKNTAKAPKKQSNFGGIFTALAIPLSFVTTVLVYLYVFGNPIHFEGNNPENLPLPGDYFGIVYKGGPIVPILMGFFLIVVIFSIERFLAIRRAKGAGSVPLLCGPQDKLANDDVDEPSRAVTNSGCGCQRTSFVVLRYQKFLRQAMTKNSMAAIQKEVEDSTSLELPPGAEYAHPSTLVSALRWCSAERCWYDPLLRFGQRRAPTLWLFRPVFPKLL